MLYVKALLPRRTCVRANLKRWRWCRERAAVRGSLAALPCTAAPAQEAAQDLDVLCREVVVIRRDEE